MAGARKPIPDDVLDKMAASYSLACSLADLHRLWPEHSVHIIRRALAGRGVRILGHAEVAQGRMAMKLDGTDAIARYVAGEDGVSLAREYGVSYLPFREWLRRNGVKLRSRAAAGKMRFAQSTPAERLAATAAMRAKRAPVTDESILVMAKGREGKPGSNWRPAHTALVRDLRQAGHKVTVNRAAARYNIPVATPRAGFDLTQSGAEWMIGHRPDRLRAFLADGLDVVTVCVSSLTFPLKPAHMQLVLQHLAWRDAHPGDEPVYVVITRRNVMLPARTIVEIPDLPQVTARAARERWAQVKNDDATRPAGSSSH